MKKHFLSLGLMLLSGVSMAQYPTSGLVAYFPLDGNGNAAGPSTITPSVFSALGATDRNGEANKCLQFVSASDHKVNYSLDDNAALQLTGDFTIAFWSKSSPELVANAMLVSLADKAGFHHALVNGNVRLYGFLYTSGGGGFQYGGNLPNAQTTWRHYVLMREGGTYYMYVNNGFQGSASAGLDPISYSAGDVFSLGQNATANATGAQTATGKLDGYLDDLLVYDRALDETERGQVFAFNTCLAINSVPTVTAAGPACAGQEVEYTLFHPNATSYSFTPENDWTGVLNGNVLTMTVPADPMFNYQYLSFTVRAENVCSTGPDQQIALPVVTPPAPFSITAPATICVGGGAPVYVEATGETISWTTPNNWVQTSTYPNSNGGVFTAGESGDITFTKTNVCFARTETHEVTVFQEPPAAATLVSGSLVLCKDAPAEFYSFQYDATTTTRQIFYQSLSTWIATADTDSSVYIQATGAWNGPVSLSAIAYNACGQTQSVPVSLTSNQNSVMADIYFYQDGTDLFAFGNPTTHTFQWLLEGNAIPNATGLTYTPTVSGNYSLEATFIDFPCEPGVTPSQYIEVLSVGVNEAAASSLNIYPNPFANEFVIEAAATTQISVMNAMGEVVLSTTINGRTSIDASSFSAGIYFIREETSGAVMKLVKH
ncbi:MAG: T9SS type A sorting domain-containing protein [Flavobacteriales bacterium]|nr:T9SS type A sorting domain-containing protein [Flavobacteriales bacterium]